MSSVCAHGFNTLSFLDKSIAFNQFSPIVQELIASFSPSCHHQQSVRFVTYVMVVLNPLAVAFFTENVANYVKIDFLGIELGKQRKE